MFAEGKRVAQRVVKPVDVHHPLRIRLGAVSVGVGVELWGQLVPGVGKEIGLELGSPDPK